MKDKLKREFITVCGAGLFFGLTVGTLALILIITYFAV